MPPDPDFFEGNKQPNAQVPQMRSQEGEALLPGAGQGHLCSLLRRKPPQDHSLPLGLPAPPIGALPAQAAAGKGGIARQAHAPGPLEAVPEPGGS